MSTYNPEKFKESSGGDLPDDLILDGVITNVQDGQVKDFILDAEGWQGSVEDKAINVTAEANYEGKAIQAEQLFTYRMEDDTTTFGPKSNMAKFAKKYGAVPKTGQKVKCITVKGYLRIKIA